MSEVEKLEREIAKKQKEMIEAQKRQFVTCTRKGCTRRVRVSNIEAAFTYRHYVEPYGCTGGDYHITGDDVEYLCPGCGKLADLPKEHPKNRLVWRHAKSKWYVYDRQLYVMGAMANRVEQTMHDYMEHKNNNPSTYNTLRNAKTDRTW